MSYEKSSRAVENACFSDITYEKPKNQGAITLQKMIFWKKLFFIFFSLSEYKP